jgi:hypothetical protein
MNRRGFVSGGAALAMLAGRALADPDDLRAAAREGWLYGLPLIEAARARTALIGDKPQVGTAGFNSFAHQRTPPSPQMRDFSAPEPDMLYSSAWIYLGGSPASIIVPPTGGRYFTLAIFDLYGNVLDTVDGHDASKTGHEVTVIGPPPRVGIAGYTAPAPRMPALHRMIHTASLWVRVLARTHLEGDHDLAAAITLQNGLEVRVKPAKARPAPSIARDAAWSDYFYAVQELINENPPPKDDIGFFRRVAPLQVGMDGGFERARFADAELAEIAQGVAEGVTLASQTPDTPQAGGWAYPKPDIGAYGQDFLYRAQVALTEPCALAPAAVTSLRAATAGGARTFPSSVRHRLLLPAAPPADGLWSLSLYEVGTDGRLFLTENPIGRHFIGGWTPGLRRQPDGAIEIVVSRADPDRGANWLPAPDHSPFALVLRTYAPGAAILARSYRPPAVETVL